MKFVITRPLPWSMYNRDGEIQPTVGTVFLKDIEFKPSGIGREPGLFRGLTLREETILKKMKPGDVLTAFDGLFEIWCYPFNSQLSRPPSREWEAAE